MLAAATTWAATDPDHIQVYGVQPGDGAMIVLDGKPDETLWREVPVMGEFHFRFRRNSTADSRLTLARAFWSGDALYFAVECLENEMPPAGKYAEIRGDVELMLESGNTQQRYYKFIARSDGSGESFFYVKDWSSTSLGAYAPDTNTLYTVGQTAGA